MLTECMTCIPSSQCAVSLHLLLLLFCFLTFLSRFEINKEEICVCLVNTHITFFGVPMNRSSSSSPCRTAVQSSNRAKVLESLDKSIKNLMPCCLNAFNMEWIIRKRSTCTKYTQNMDKFYEIYLQLVEC